MIRFYLDTEFNGFGGEMISLALVRQDGESIYLISDQDMEYHPWVAENVIPHLYAAPILAHSLPLWAWGNAISQFIYRDGEIPQIIADWPSDIMDFCKLLITGPGEAVPMGKQTHCTVLRHIDVYPTDLEGAVQHNAWWDAMALRRFVELGEQP